MKKKWIALILYVAAANGFADATNYLNNGSFETQGSWSETAQYWEDGYPDGNGALWGTASRRDWRSYSGSYEGTVCGTWAGNVEGGMWQQVAVEAGRELECSGWFWSDRDLGIPNVWTSANQGLKIEFFSDPPENYNLISAVTNEFLSQAMWNRQSVRGTVPPGAVWARVVVYAYGVGANGALQFDDISLHDYEPEPFNPGPCSRRTPLVFSEIMYHPAERVDERDLEYVEIYNTEPMSWDLSGWEIKGDIDYTFAEGTVLGPQSYLVVAHVPTDVETVYTITNVVGPYTNKLANSSSSFKLVNAQGAELLEVEYADSGDWPVAADGAGHSLAIRNPSYGEGDVRAWGLSSLRGGSPGEGEPVVSDNYQDIVINEFLAHTDLPDVDYLELYNAGTQAVSLAGCILADEPDENTYVIPGGTTIPAGGFLSFDATTLGFNLSSYGEDIYFKDPGDTRVIDAVRFMGQVNGVSCGRYPDGDDVFHVLTSQTPGTNNTPPILRDIVINEIMYNPASGEDKDEYIELYNRSGSSVDVGGWRFLEGIEYTIPEGTVISAGGYLVVAADAQHLITNYTQLTAANTVGDYDGKLSNSGEPVMLAALDDPADTNGQAWVVMDRVFYRDGGAWGRWADGGGSSLELRDPDADNRLAANWGNSDEYDKSSWTTCVVTGQLGEGLLTSGGSIDQVDLMLLRRGECLVDYVEVIPQGSGNVVRNNSFESGSSYWYLRGNHVRSEVVNSNAYSGSRVLHLRATGSGDTRANRVTGDLSSPLGDGNQATLRCRVRWLKGDPHFLMRLLGGYLEATCKMEIPANLGTPGQANSCVRANVGPAVHAVTHSPMLPGIHDAVEVQVRADDSDGVSSVQLYYRVDPSSSYSSLAMTRDARGVYRAEIPAQGDDVLLAYYVQATDSNAVSARFPADADRECFVRLGDVPSGNALGIYHVWVDNDGINTWSNRSPLSNEPIPATFVSGDRVIYDAGVRYRGSPFIRRMADWVNPETAYAPAYRVEFADDDKFLGSDEINLDWLEVGRDASYQRERSAFWMAGQLGLPAIYQRYVSVVVNGLHRGVIYTDSQHIEKDFLESWYPDADDGDFHKINDWFEFSHDLNLWTFDYRDAALDRYEVDGDLRTARYRWCWERKKVGTYDNSYTNLLMLVEAMNDTGDGYAAGIESLADAEQWMRTFAFRHAIGDWDSYGYQRGKNMFAYRPDDDKWQMLLWDMDFCLGAVDSHPYNHDLFDVSTNMPIVKEMILSAPFKRMYRRALVEVVNGPFLSSEFDSVADDVYNGLHDNGANVGAPTDMKNWVQARRGYIVGELSSVTSVPLSITESSLTTSSNQITIHGSAPVQAYGLAINGEPVNVIWTNTTSWTLHYVLKPGETTLTLQALDRDGSVMTGLGSDSLSVTCTATFEAPQDHLVINEIMYNAPLTSADFVELHNTSTDNAFDLYSMRLAGVDLTFTESVLVPPGGYVVLAENQVQFAIAYGYDIPVAAVWSGSLDNGGEDLRLEQLDGVGMPTATVDQVTYDDVLPWPLAADGEGPSLQLIDPNEDNDRVGNWAVGSTCTPGVVNSVLDDLAPFPDTRLNEVESLNDTVIQDGAGDYDPWLELFNADGSDFACSNYYITDDYTNLLKWAFPNDAVITGRAFQVVWMDNETGETSGTEYHAGCLLSSSGGGVALVHNDAGRAVVVDYLNYNAISADRSYGSFPDGSTNQMFFYYATPAGTNNANGPIPHICINEWMADNDSGIVDPATASCEDWFELYNSEEYAVDIAGYSLTDDLADPTQWVITESVILQPGEHRLVWADGEPSANLWGTNVLHADFKLGKGGESIGIYDPGGGAVDSLTFGAQSTDISEGRFPDGDPVVIMAFSISTPGSQNLVSTNQYTINASAGINGVVSPSGEVEVVYGYALEFDIQAEDYYVIDQLLTNGAPVTVSGATGHVVYTWSSITANGTLSASFTAQTATNETPVWWLAENGLTNGSWDSAALADQDADGISSWAEYVAGTQPTNAESVLQVEDPLIESGGLHVLSWPSVAGRVYQVEYATNLLAGFSVLSDATNLPATPSMNQYTNAVNSNETSVFYRIVVELE